MAIKYLTQNISSSGLNTDIQVGGIGFIVRLTIFEKGTVVDLSGATTKKIIIKRPDGSILNYDAAFTTDGADGKIEYVTVSGDLNTAGTYSVQSNLILSAFEGYSTISTFLVNANL